METRHLHDEKNEKQCDEVVMIEWKLVECP